jgi:hypothetical protein
MADWEAFLCALDSGKQLAYALRLEDPTDHVLSERPEIVAFLPQASRWATKSMAELGATCILAACA